MKKYWDYSKPERAKLAEEEVTGMLALHLMEKGILPLEPLVLQPVPTVEIKSVGRALVFNGIAFDSIEKARIFVDLKPCKLDYDWRASSKYHYLAPLDGPIEEREVFSKADLANANTRLTEIGAIVKANEAAESDFYKHKQAVDGAQQEVWEDWHSCRRQEERHKKLIATWNEYKNMAGDDEMASGFLQKVFSREDIAAAAQWTGTEIPMEFARMAEARPAEEAAPAPAAVDDGIPV